MDAGLLLAEALATQSRLVKAQEELTGAIAVLAQEQVSLTSEPYVSIDDLLAQLGSLFTRSRVMDDLRAGWFKLGRDYINVSNGDRATYGFRVKCIRAIYEADPAKRKQYKGAA